MQKLGKDLWHNSEPIAAKTVAYEKLCLKVMKRPVLTGQASIFNFNFFEKSVTQNNLFCCLPIIFNLILKISPKFQGHSSHFSEVNELLNEHFAKKE